MSLAKGRSPALVFALLLTPLACTSSSSSPEDTPELSLTPAVAEGEPLSTSSTVGPVTATVTVIPKEPLIGDIMSLTLKVEAEKGVRVEMPVFQEAFTRFSIEGYSDEREATESGGERHTQGYRMQAATSGRLRIPPLRVVFIDERPDAEEGERELLTDELSLKIRPVLEGEQAGLSLQPIRRPLEEDMGPGFWQRTWWVFFSGAVAIIALVALYFIRRSKKVYQISAYERASIALSELEAAGLPEQEALDSWYVQLSSIVRRYLEDRFGLRAPELTTEEFLRVAQRSAQLSPEHKALLISFLEDCDQVKFAGYEPGSEESRAALEAARRFLLETRVVASDGPPVALVSAPADVEAA